MEETEKKLGFFEKIKYRKLVKLIEKKRTEWEKSDSMNKELLVNSLWALVEQGHITLFADEEEKVLHTLETLKKESLEALIDLMEDVINELRTTVGMSKELRRK